MMMIGEGGCVSAVERTSLTCLPSPLRLRLPFDSAVALLEAAAPSFARPRLARRSSSGVAETLRCETPDDLSRRPMEPSRREVRRGSTWAIPPAGPQAWR